MNRNEKGQFTYVDPYERLHRLADRATRRLSRAVAAWQRGDSDADRLVRDARRFAVRVIREIEELEDSDG